jgi:hypothetical protein
MCLIAAAVVTTAPTLTFAQSESVDSAEPEPPPEPAPAPAPPRPPSWSWLGDGPERMKYVEGDPVPPGYHVRSERSYGLIMGGGITFGCLYGLAVGLASSASSSALYVPVLGPFIEAAGVKDGMGSGATTLILAIWGLGEAAGAIMLVSGIASTKTELVRDDLARLHVIPILTKSTAGLGLGGAF